MKFLGLSIVKKSKNQKEIEKLGKLAKPLMKHLAKNHHPHTCVRLDSTSCEVLEGVMSYRTEKYIVD